MLQVTAANQKLQALKGTMPKNMGDKLLTTDQVQPGNLDLPSSSDQFAVS